MCPQTTKNLFNLHIKGTQYGGGQPKGIMMDWDIIQIDRRKRRRQGKKETKRETKKEAKTERKK